MKKLKPIHPGEMLWEEFMKPMGLSQNAVGRALHVSPRRINEIIHGKRSLTADTALRLSRFFGTTPQFWINSQANYDLRVAENKLTPKLLQWIKPFAKMQSAA